MSIKVTSRKPKSWHGKIAANRGAEWQQAIKKGRLDAMKNPSLIRLVRIRKGLLQADVAKDLKINVSTLGQIERGMRPVKRKTASTIANYLGMTSTKLFKPFDKNGKKFVALIQKL